MASHLTLLSPATRTDSLTTVPAEAQHGHFGGAARDVPRIKCPTGSVPAGRRPDPRLPPVRSIKCTSWPGQTGLAHARRSDGPYARWQSDRRITAGRHDAATLVAPRE